jgi:hypothetical protein
LWDLTELEISVESRGKACELGGGGTGRCEAALEIRILEFQAMTSLFGLL